MSHRDRVGLFDVAPCSEEQVPAVGGCARCDGEAGKLPDGSTSKTVHGVC